MNSTATPSDDVCRLAAGQSINESCFYVKSHSDICEGGGFIHYTSMVYCHSPALFTPLIIACCAWLSVLFLALSVAADSFFCPSLAVIVDHLKISQNIAGVTFLAFGNGAPDIFSSIASVLSSDVPKPGLALGALMGAGIFLTTVIVGTVTMIKPFNVMRRPLIRDLIFFLGTAGWAFYILFKQKIHSWEAIGFICLYVVYATVVIVGRVIRVKLKNRAEEGRQRIIDDWTNPEDESPVATVSGSQSNLSSPPRNQAESSPDEGANPDDQPQLRRQDSVLEEANWRYDVFRHGALADRIPSVQPENYDDTWVDSLVVVPQGNLLQLYAKDLWKGIRSFSHEGWKEAGKAGKAFIIIKSPVVFILNLTIPVVNLEVEGQNWSKPLVMAQCFLCPITAFLFINRGFPVIVIIVLIGLCFAVLFGALTRRDEPPKYHKFLAYAGFLMAVLWIYILASEVVGIVTMIGIVARVSQDLLGLTLLAWSNSLGDLISDIAVTRQGFPRMALSACIGGPLFNLLLGIGISFTIATFRTGSAIPLVFNGVRKVLIGFLGWSIVSSLILLPLAGFRANRVYAGYLYAVYAAFLIMVILTEKEVIVFPE